jgi:hypothetical protein
MGDGWVNGVAAFWRRYRVFRAALVVAALLPFVVAGIGRGDDAPTAATAHGVAGGGPVGSGIVGPVSAGVAPGAVRLRLGRFDAPATDAVARSGIPDGVPLAGGAQRSLSLTRAALPPFRAVGVTWTGVAGAVTVAVRGRTGQGAWGPWYTAGPAGGFDDQKTGVRDGAQLLWLGTSDAVQVTVAAAAGSTESTPDDVAVDLIDPRVAPGDAVPVPPVTAASVDATRVARPPIHTRGEWGADERLMSWPPRYTSPVRALAWHDQPIGGDYAETDVPGILRALYYYDAVSRGWGDIGDNVLVDRFGRLWEGRYGGLSRAVVGAHTPGRNVETAGIGVLGGSGPAPGPELEATARYVAWKLSIGPAVDPRGDTQVPSTGPASAPVPAPPPASANVAPVATASRPVAAVAAPAAPAKPAPGPVPRGAAAAREEGAPAPVPAVSGAPAAGKGDSVGKRPAPVRSPLAAHGAVTPSPAAKPAKPVATPTPRTTAKPTTRADPTKRAPTRAKAATHRSRPARKAPRTRYPEKAPLLATVTVPRVFAADQAAPAVLPALRDRAYTLMGSWSRPETMRRTLAVWTPARAAFTELGQDAPTWTGQPGDVPVPADYDGDGELDVATWTPSTGVWTIHNSSGGTTEGLVLGHRGDVPVPADYDGDGRADPATWTPKTGTWHVRGRRDTGYGRAGDKPVPADYTGDGRADLAVYRGGLWLINGVGRISLGESWHIPVPADYDGDGKADPATWSTTSYRWFFRGRPPVSFGTAGDVPVPGQYDGDGRADLAVWHPGSWQIRGVNGVVSYPVGTVGDVPTTLG